MSRLVTMFCMAGVMALAGGCLSAIRLPCEDPRFTKYSDEGECTNRVWKTFISDRWRKENSPLRGLYPTVKIRWHATRQVYFNDRYYFDKRGEPLMGEELYRARMTKAWYWLPLTVVWLTSPFDAAMDTVCIPWDW